jgi:hypothetical protein
MKIKIKKVKEQKSEMREIIEKAFGIEEEKPQMREDKVRAYQDRQKFLKSFVGTQAEELANLVLQKEG